YPRIGAQRELKRQLERYWRREVDWPALANEGARLRRSHWERQRAAGIDRIPSNDFSYYDHVLDLSVLLGNVPARFQWTGDEIPPELYFEMARGKAPAASPSGCRGDAAACEMTKWFDTN